MQLAILCIFALTCLALVSCNSSEVDSSSHLPAGNAARGAELFRQSVNGAPACSACHALDGSTLVGPNLGDFSNAVNHRDGGNNGEDYAYTSIVRPAAYVVDGFSNNMYAQYGRRLNDQQIADLIAYLLALGE